MKIVRYISPLRYPGGKAKLAGFIAQLLECNNLGGGTYIEPYAGGASVALALLISEGVARVQINDVDPTIYAFWHSVLNAPEELCRLIRDRPVSIMEWKRHREIQRSPQDNDLLTLGFSTFFLNRTNRSGIICSGGVIGGLSQCGKWKLDARYNKNELINRIERIALFANRISLHRQDAAAFLRARLPRLPKNSFLYLDPPYYVKGTSRLYANFYRHDDHVAIASLIQGARIPWLVSYDDRIEIRRMYHAFRNSRYCLSYTARNRYEGREVLFFSDGLEVPASDGRK